MLGAAMRMIIEARIVSGTGTEKTISLADIERVDGDFKQLGLNLSEGRDLMHDVLMPAETGHFQAKITEHRPDSCKLNFKLFQ